jgi:hypothetical protein
MLATSPITRQSVGHTFTVALVVLGLGVVSQLGAVGWAVIARRNAPPPPLGDTPTFAKLSPTALRPDFGQDLLTEMPDQPPDTLTTDPESGVPPKPTPVPTTLQRAPEAVPQTRFDELIQQGKILRDQHQNAGNALTKFREASAMDPRNPIAIAELASTYDKMGLADRGAEQWKRIYDMGSAAGIYFSLAESKLKETQARAILSVMPQPGTVSGSGPDLSSAVDGIAPGALIGLGKISLEEQIDSDSLKKFTLRIPIKARPRAKIEVRDLVIHVLFYDKVDGRNVVQTSANVSSKWATSPTDWADSDTEELAVDYQLPRPEPRARRETREYFGYLVRVYYKQQLQASVADPERLGDQYPAPSVLPPNDR